MQLSEDNLIFKVISGSKAYGLSTPNSDTDTRGAYICKPYEQLGLTATNYSFRRSEQEDTYYYELSKLVGHMADGEPNWVEIAFINNPVISDCHWNTIVENRDLFLTKALIRRSLGFMGGMVARSKKQKNKHDIEPYLEKPNYQKEVMHAIRMGRMSKDLLLTGNLIVDRSFERESLLRLRTGEIPIENGYDECEILCKEIEELLPQSNLPEICNHELLSEIVSKVITNYWRDHNWI